MLTKRNIITLSLILMVFLAVSTGLQGLVHHGSCTIASCERVHGSSLGRVFSIPFGLWAVPCLLFVMVLHLKKRRTTVCCALAAMLGAELYLTFVQLYFIHAFCLLCLCFLALLFLSFLLALHRSILARAGLVTCLFFLCFHFFLFFPDIEPRCTLAQVPGETRIEVFGSPSCSHCKEAIAELKVICSDYGADLVLRPVPLSPADYEPTLDWVCRLFFEENTQSAKKVGSKIVWRNEKSLKKLEGNEESPNTLPVVVVTTPQGSRLFRGWDDRFKESLYQVFQNNALGRLKTDMNAIKAAKGGTCAPKRCGQ
jgi:uncharacterized membrane protein